MQAPVISVNLEAYAITIQFPETCLYPVGIIYITLVQKFLLEKTIGNIHKKSKTSYETWRFLNTILSSLRQPNHFITQGIYIGYIFRL